RIVRRSDPRGQFTVTAARACPFDRTGTCHSVLPLKLGGFGGSVLPLNLNMRGAATLPAKRRSQRFFRAAVLYEAVIVRDSRGSVPAPSQDRSQEDAVPTPEHHHALEHFLRVRLDPTVRDGDRRRRLLSRVAPPDIR